MSDVWPVLPRGWFESHRRYRRRVAEYEARFAERYDVVTLPGGERVATLRPEWLTVEELRADPIRCEECGEPAEFHGVDGWLCGECADERDPRYEG